MAILLKDTATGSLVLLAAALLIFSALGPALDHHFAERHPDHSHMYLGTVGPDHSHPFEHSHIHYEEMYAPPDGDRDILYFAPFDGFGHAHSDVIASAAPSLPDFEKGDGPLLKTGFVSDAALPGVSVAPHHQPPRS